MTNRIPSTFAATTRRAFRAAPLLAGTLLAGCNAAPADADAAPGGSDAAPTGGGLSFATEREALDWVANRATELEMGEVTVERDGDGQPTKVTGVSIGAPAEIARKRAQLLGELGGPERTVRVAGEAFKLGDERGEAQLVAQHCNGSLCTTEESFKNDYFFYREIGSRTTLTSGGYETQRKTIKGTGAYECVDLPGPLPVTCNEHCNYPTTSCPSGFTQESVVGYPGCTITCVGQVRNVTLSLSIEAFELFGSNSSVVPSIPPKYGTTHDTSLEVTHWEVTSGISDTAISAADGLCGSHLTTGPNGNVGAYSHWGTVPATCQ